MRSIVVPAISLALAGLLAACSSSSSSTANSSGSAGISPPPGAASTAGSPAAPASSAGSPTVPASPAGGGNASAQIKTNWEAFFSGKTSAAQKIALLQNGQKFAQTINAQAGSSLSQSAGAQVTGVVVNGNSAKVTYNITLAGKSALPNQVGTAVLVNGSWLVGDASFCSLLTLENAGTPPSVCKSVSG
jgi:hypothetical protein